MARADATITMAFDPKDRALLERVAQNCEEKMRAGIKSEHWHDANGKPAGGSTFGNGFAISWQNGPLGRGEQRREPNGAFVEDIIVAACDRLNWYQNSEFSCDANQEAMEYLNRALEVLDARTRDREARSVEGTHRK